MYVGEVNSAMGIGDIMGHEAIRIVEEVRPEVKDLKVGDRVTILPVPNWRVNGEESITLRGGQLMAQKVSPHDFSCVGALAMC